MNRAGTGLATPLHRVSLDGVTLSFFNGIKRPKFPQPLPAPDSSDWTFWAGRISDHFLCFCPVYPRPRMRQLLVIHPRWTAIEEQARQLYNGEVEPGQDADGNMIPLPRVWRYEFELVPFFIMELPATMSARSILLWSGDRQPALA